MAEELTQGGRANRSGSVLEGIVIGALAPHGFVVVQYRDYARNPEGFGTELLIKNAPFTTLYGTRGQTEFLLRSANYGLEVRIECKWQQTAGSVDEKLPYLYLSAIEAIPEHDVILLVDGQGFRPGAVDWLRKTADSRRFIPEDRADKRVMVMGATEFMTWANKTFR